MMQKLQRKGNLMIPRYIRKDSTCKNQHANNTLILNEVHPGGGNKMYPAEPGSIYLLPEKIFTSKWAVGDLLK